MEEKIAMTTVKWIEKKNLKFILCLEKRQKTNTNPNGAELRRMEYDEMKTHRGEYCWSKIGSVIS